MSVLIFRTIILYIIATIIIRMMGKRQIGQLQPFELVITIMISELATLPMQDNRIPLINGIIPIITLLILQIIFSLLQLKSIKIRNLVSGKPSILIYNGEINRSEMKYQRINLNDLMEELRLKGYFDISDVKYAILETSGQLSIIPAAKVESVTKGDLNIKSQQSMIPITLVLDGKLDEQNLKVINKDMDWLNNQLKINNISCLEDIFIAMIDSKGKFFFQLKNDGGGKKIN